MIQRGEHQAVHENDQARFFQILELGAFNFAIHLREGFFSAHGQHGMPERDKNGDNSNLRENSVSKPSQSIGTEMQVSRIREGRKRGMPQQGGVNAPAD
jgi:hypothetical protein